MGHYPALQEFIDKHASEFRNLKVTFSQGAPPTLFMQDEQGKNLDEVSVAQWKTEHLTEYLTEKLKAS